MTGMRIGVALVVAVLAAIVLSVPGAKAQSVADFYKGKTLQFGVGYPPGGGFDVYARAAARFIGKHIPGNPQVIVINVPGASSLNYVRYIHDVAPKDGTQFGMFERALIAGSVYEPSKVKVNFRDFTWIGSMNSDLGICVLWNRHDLKTVADIQKYKGDVALAGTSKNGGGYVYAALLKSMSPRNVKQVFGYKGTNAMLLAAEQGEVDGTCGHLSSIQTSNPDLLAKKMINVVVQYAEKRDPALPDVQTAYEIARTDNDRKIINFLTSATRIGRPIIAPPRIPADRAAALQKAFMDTMKDPAFLAFAKKSKMELDPIGGKEAVKIVESILATPPEAVEATRKILE